LLLSHLHTAVDVDGALIVQIRPTGRSGSRLCRIAPHGNVASDACIRRGTQPLRMLSGFGA